MKTTAKKGGWLVASFYLLLFIIWEVLTLLHVGPDYLFPSPIQVIRRLIELAQDNYLWPSIKVTLLRMVFGFLMAAAIGLFIGILMGTNWVVNRLLKSLFLGLQMLPTAAWVPLSLLIFGLSDRGIYFVIIMSSTSAVAIATSDGILNIPPIYMRAARTLGTPRWAMYHRVIVPASLPSVVTGLKLGWTLGWHGAVSAELIKSTMGLGFLLYMGRELNDASQVIAIMLLTIVFGLCLDRFLFGIVESRIRRRWGLTGEEELSS
jgi:NitT/TauT family transport system permease protein